jgi:hypothetical protein
MTDHVETIRDLDRGERVRVETDTDTTIELTVTGRTDETGDHLRLDLSADTDDADYRFESRREGDGWTTPELHRQDHGSSVWATMGEVERLEPLGETEAVQSEDDASGDSRREE